MAADLAVPGVPGRRALLALVAALLVAASAAGLYFAYRTFATSGERAVAAMNAEERTTLERVRALDARMSAEQVFETLGEPTEDLTFLAKWSGFAGSSLSQARVYFVDGRPVKLRWIKLGYFTYERKL